MSQCKRIAMWAVPRSLGTALYRAWANRPDTTAFDEPFFVAYVHHTGEDLGVTREMVAESGRPTSYAEVVDELFAPLPEGKTIAYQKHQPHNILVEFADTDWLWQVEHCFLIRHPAYVLTSLRKLVPRFTFEETGWPKLLEMFELVRAKTGRIPPIIDAHELQNHPQDVLEQLCEAVGVPFRPEMLSWPSLDLEAFPEVMRTWQGVVLQSTGFKPSSTAIPEVPPELRPMLAACEEIYEKLRPLRLKPRIG